MILGAKYILTKTHETLTRCPQAGCIVVPVAVDSDGQYLLAILDNRYGWIETGDIREHTYDCYKIIDKPDQYSDCYWWITMSKYERYYVLLEEGEEVEL